MNVATVRGNQSAVPRLHHQCRQVCHVCGQMILYTGGFTCIADGQHIPDIYLLCQMTEAAINLLDATVVSDCYRARQH